MTRRLFSPSIAISGSIAAALSAALLSSRLPMAATLAVSLLAGIAVVVALEYRRAQSERMRTATQTEPAIEFEIDVALEKPSVDEERTSDRTKPAGDQQPLRVL